MLVLLLLITLFAECRPFKSISNSVLSNTQLLSGINSVHSVIDFSIHFTLNRNITTNDGIVISIPKVYGNTSGNIQISPSIYFSAQLVRKRLVRMEMIYCI